MAKAMEALGMIETRGFVTLVEASDAMMKAANKSMFPDTRIQYCIFGEALSYTRVNLTCESSRIA